MESPLMEIRESTNDSEVVVLQGNNPSMTTLSSREFLNQKIRFTNQTVSCWPSLIRMESIRRPRQASPPTPFHSLPGCDIIALDLIVAFTLDIDELSTGNPGSVSIESIPREFRFVV
jgi:hypothetical protein